MYVQGVRSNSSVQVYNNFVLVGEKIDLRKNKY